MFTDKKVQGYFISENEMAMIKARLEAAETLKVKGKEVWERLSIYVADRDLEKLNGRVRLVEQVLAEVKANPGCVELAGGEPHVWEWFKMYLWNPILTASTLSDEGKLSVMRKCVKEKILHPNAEDKGMNRLIHSALDVVKEKEKNVQQAAVAARAAEEEGALSMVA